MSPPPATTNTIIIVDPASPDSWQWGPRAHRGFGCLALKGSNVPGPPEAAPELVTGVLESLPGEDYGRAGVDRQGQAVVEIHVVQPILGHLPSAQEGAQSPNGS